jgi:tetratricopeptide repeat protein 21B
MLERTLVKIKNNNITEARILSELGRIYLMQGFNSFEKAMKAFRDGLKKDPNSVKSLTGLILCQLAEGAYEDAESQLEMVSLSYNLEELGYEISYFQSLIVKHTTGKITKADHLSSLMRCYEMFIEGRDSSMKNTAGLLSSEQQMSLGSFAKPRYLNAFSSFHAINPDFAIILALEFFSHLESSSTVVSLIPSTNSLLNNSVGTASAEENNSGENNENAVNHDASNILGKGGEEGGEGNTAIASRCGLELLQSILQFCPGIMITYIEIARFYCMFGKYEEAMRILQQCLSLQPQSSAILLALAMVELYQFHTIQANRLLEQALASDFSIRNVNKFRLIKAIIRGQQGKFNEAIQEMEQMMLNEYNFSLPSSSSSSSNAANAGEGKEPDPSFPSGAHKGGLSAYSDPLRLTEDDQVCSFIVYASLLSKERRLKEANKVLSHAKVIFAGSSHEVSILIASSQLYVERGDYDNAIRMLEKVSSDSSSYPKALIAKAEIILKYNHDKEGFTKCFINLVEKNPTIYHYTLLGDAYLKILNPDSAIDALERAYKMDPSNTRLRGKIGKALIATHEYHRAVEFYESALREASRAGIKESSSTSSILDTLQLSHDLAKLYINLGNHTAAVLFFVFLSRPFLSLSFVVAVILGRLESASRVLSNALIDNPADVLSMKQNVSTLVLMSSITQMLSSEEINDALTRAYSFQKEIVAKTRSSSTMIATSSEQIEEEKHLLSSICEKLGSTYLKEGQEGNSGAAVGGEEKGRERNEGGKTLQQAEGYYSEALQSNPQNIQAMLGLANTFLLRKEYEPCLLQCNKVITGKPDERAGALLASEVNLLIDQTDRSIEILSNYLVLKPNDYLALEKSIHILRKAGKLSLVPSFFLACEKFDRRCINHAGYHYCQGLYSRFTNDIGKAITELHYCRRDDVWGASALTHMVELYLNPDQEGAWEEKETGPVDDITRSHINAAEELLKELRPIAK